MLVKPGRDRFAFNIIGYSVSALIGLACVIPFILVVSGSVTSEQSIYKDGYRLIPRAFSMDAYRIIFKAPEGMAQAYGVTVSLTVFGTILGLFITAMAAYVLQRKEFKHGNFFSFYFFFTTLFSGGLVPWYILMVRYLHLKNSFLALLLPPMLNIFYIIIMRSFMKSIPEAVTESAKMDGAGYFRIFVVLIIPMSTPAMASIGLFIALDYWNDWYNAMLFIGKDKLYPLQYFLYRILNSINFANSSVAASGVPLPKMPSESFKLAMTVVATGPIILLYPFVQKYFVRGIVIGAVKG